LGCDVFSDIVGLKRNLLALNAENAVTIFAPPRSGVQNAGRLAISADLSFLTESHHGQEDEMHY